jgi:hypothetical protein
LTADAAKAPEAVNMVLGLAEQIAAQDVPAALQTLAAKLSGLEAKIAASVSAETSAHPIAAAAIVAGNALLMKLFPNEGGLITELEKLDL